MELIRDKHGRLTAVIREIRRWARTPLQADWRGRRRLLFGDGSHIRHPVSTNRLG